jgi:2-keto-myo-inositol isomerase
MQLCLGVTASIGEPLTVAIRAAARAGFRCLDLGVPKLEAYLADYPLILLDAYLRENGVYAASISGMELFPFRSKVGLLTIQAHFLELCTRLDALGGGIIVVYPALRPDWDVSEKEVSVQTASVLQRFSDLAAPFEVNIAFEFRCDEIGSVRSLAHSQQIVQRVARPNVGLALNTLEFYLGGSEPEEIDELDVGRLWLVHLADAKGDDRTAPRREDLALPGYGAVPVKEICERLTDKGFRGPYSVAAVSDQRPLGEAALSVRQAALDVLSCLRLRDAKA